MRDRLARLGRERRALIALVALVYTALFLPAVLYVQPSLSPASLVITLLGSFLYGWALFFTLRAVRPLFLMLVPLLFACSAVASYYMFQFRFEMTYQQLAVITEVQPQTAFAFITWKLVVWVFTCTAIGIYLARRSVKREVHDPKDARLLFITVILIASIFVQEAGTITQRYFPYNLLFAAKGFIHEKILLSDAHEQTASITYPTADPITVVLIVGESVRAQNWGLNGYTRQTTPLLTKRDGLINFTDVTSCFPLTRVAVPCILTNASYKHPVAPQYSLLKLFRQMGFFTASIDMHGMSDSVFGNPVSKILNEGNQLISFNGSFIAGNNVDDAGVESLQKLLRERQENLFVFFHPFGSHWPFDTRYPERFRVFKPVCNPLHNSLVALAQDMSECVPQELVNAYDNSILYADHIVNEVLESLKGRAALVMFTSDHGQSLGEDGLFLHGHPDAVMERKVPMVVWATPEFTKRFGPQLARMQANQDKPTSHDNVFHTLLDCVGAKGPMIDPKQSLCQ